MERITQKHLDGAIGRLNKLLERPETPYTKTTDGKFKANPGNFHIDYAYGGAQVVEMSNEGGGVRSYGGHEPKRDCYYKIHDMIKGVELEQERKAV